MNKELKEFQSLENDVCHAKCCIGCKWLMDQMCSKCKIHCFSHKPQKISEHQNFRKFLKKIFCLNLFFSKILFCTKMFFSDKFFSKNFSLLSRPLHCQGVKLSYKSYKILYFWNCPIKSYIFSKCPINLYFQQKQQFLSIGLSISRVWVM